MHQCIMFRALKKQRHMQGKNNCKEAQHKDAFETAFILNNSTPKQKKITSQAAEWYSQA